MFKPKKCLVRFIFEGALSQTVELPKITSRILDICDSTLAYIVTYRVFIYWEFPSLTFLKVNFHASVSDKRRDVGFVIHGLDSKQITAWRAVH